MLDFGGVSQIADVYVDGEHLYEQVGGWVPFSVDVTEHAKPGESFELAVRVRGGNRPPIVDALGKPLHPVGWSGHEWGWGLCYPVYLRLHGSFAVTDAFIKASWQDKTLSVDYTLRSFPEGRHTLRIVSDIFETTDFVDGNLKNDAKPVLTMSREKGVKISREGSEEDGVQDTIAWPDPTAWTPDDPHLYVMRTRLYEGGTLHDESFRRFGFREIAIDGTHYTLNGVPVWLRGDSMVTQSQHRIQPERLEVMSPETWPRTLDTLRSLNINTLRFHQSSPPDWVIDLCDAKGMMVIDESAAYARTYLKGVDRDLYIANAQRWIVPWVKGHHNHPSVVVWSAENELQDWLQYFSPEQMLRLGDTIRKHDTTRPVIYEGEKDVGDATYALHYPEGYTREPTDGLYSWADKFHKTKPTHIGEFITGYGGSVKRNRWWQGTYVRGLRYLGVADVRPYQMRWAGRSGNPEFDAPRINLRNSYAPVAVFDKAYDALGIDPLMDEAKRPELNAGERVTRCLIVYNEAWSGEAVEVTVELRAGGVAGKTLGLVKQTVQVPLGERRELDAMFTVPTVASGELDVVLRASKGGEVRFEEVRPFRITGGGSGAAAGGVEGGVEGGRAGGEGSRVRGMSRGSMSVTSRRKTSRTPGRGCHRA